LRLPAQGIGFLPQVAFGVVGVEADAALRVGFLADVAGGIVGVGGFGSNGAVDGPGFRQEPVQGVGPLRQARSYYCPLFSITKWR
jgi:hypothetical protein